MAAMKAIILFLFLASVITESDGFDYDYDPCTFYCEIECETKAMELVDKTLPDTDTVLTKDDFEIPEQSGAATDDGCDCDCTKDEITSDKNVFQGDISGLDQKKMRKFVKKSKQFANIIDRAFSRKTPDNALKDLGFLDLDGFHNAIRDPMKLWPKATVPVVLSGQFSQEGRRILAQAMLEFHDKTCIRFVGRTDETEYIRIESRHPFCSSNVGKQQEQPQSVNIGGLCLSKGIVMHELMHTVGFFHEQSRKDRYKYVRVLKKNIVDGYKDQFLRYDLEKIQLLDTPYDYDSIMHYPKNAFSKNGKNTIEPMLSNVQIGQRDHLSNIDIEKLNKLYNCESGTCNDARPWCAIIADDDMNWCKYGFLQRKCRKSCGVCKS